MRLFLNDLQKLIAKHPILKLGCIVDTNALFAGAMPLDKMNTWAESAFKHLHDLGVPTFTNINIRSEFLDLQRRVLVAEGLVSMYDRSKTAMDNRLRAQLKSLKTSKDETALAGKLFKLNDQQMKKYRTLLNTLPEEDGLNGWDAFCQSFLRPIITKVWDEAIDDMKIQFVGTRAIESREYFDRDPNWKDMTDIIGRFAVGSSDAMIINFFLCSKFSLIVTGDEDVAYAVERMSGGTKYVLVPDEAMERSA